MNQNKVFVSTFPFSRASALPLDLLKQSPFEYSINPLGRKLTGQELYDYAKDATAVIVGTEDLSVLVEKSQNLKLIARIGIGLDSVPLKECLLKNIKVCYTPDAVTDAVAELTIGNMISLTRKVFLADQEIRNKKWQRFEGKSLKEQTIGLFGFGRIGKRVTELLAPFRPYKILVSDIADKSDEIKTFKSYGLNIEQVPFEDLIVHSDTISIHVPKTPKTNNQINETTLSKMKDGVLLVNTARGGIINELDLMKFLDNGKVGAAALDVFSKEPYAGDLCKYKQIILTQHMGSCSFEARNRMEKETVEDVLRFFRNEKIQSPVDINLELENLKA